jgi:hypothetical protein
MQNFDPGHPNFRIAPADSMLALEPTARPLTRLAGQLGPIQLDFGPFDADESKMS